MPALAARCRAYGSRRRACPSRKKLCARSFFRDGHARRRDPYARQRAAKAGIFQRLAASVAILAVADQQKLKPSGPIGRLRIVDMFGCGIKGLPPFRSEEHTSELQ